MLSNICVNHLSPAIQKTDELLFPFSFQIIYTDEIDSFTPMYQRCYSDSQACVEVYTCIWCVLCITGGIMQYIERKFLGLTMMFRRAERISRKSAAPSNSVAKNRTYPQYEVSRALTSQEWIQQNIRLFCRIGGYIKFSIIVSSLNLEIRNTTE